MSISHQEDGMKKIAFFVLIGFMAAIIASCVISAPRVGPPPPRSEVMPAKPGPNHVWIGGYWKWSGNKYVWAPGHWTKAKLGKSWVPGHWEKRGPHWVWKKGHWR
jgi:hypothetical protein